MKLSRLAITNIRNIEAATLLPGEELTVICGPNGQGKTNLLESIWLLTGSKSFRGAKDMELVREGEAFGRIVAGTFGDGREHEIELAVAGPESGKRGRSAKVNGAAYGRATNIAGIFTAVVFEPGHLSLVKGGPDGRRRFLDAALCQLYPGYIGTLRRFGRAVSQKNALLKKYHDTRDAAKLLDVFDAEISATGEEMMRRRREYLALAGPAAEKVYDELSSGAEALRIRYQPSAEEGGLRALLKTSRPVDIRAGFCTTGPQREDFETTVAGRNARTFGSQGQQRSAVLSLKLAEAAVAKRITGEHPVLLLDDVLSELDEGRQAYLLSRMEGKQSFVTTCDAAAFARTAGRVVQMRGGRIVE